MPMAPSTPIKAIMAVMIPAMRMSTAPEAMLEPVKKERSF